MCSSARYAEVACEEQQRNDICIECTTQGVIHARARADSLLTEGRINEAAEWLSKCIALFECIELADESDNLLSAVLADRAFIYIESKRWFDAEEDCNAALKLDRRNNRARYCRAFVLHEVGRIEDAFRDVQEVLKRPRDLALEATSLKARILKARQEDKARLNYARYFQLDPEKVTLAEVKLSCAGVLGWLNASIDEPGCRVITLHAREECTDTPVFISCTSVAGNNVATMRTSQKQSLQQFRRALAAELVDHEMNLRLTLPDGTLLTKADDSKPLIEVLSRGALFQ